MRLDQRVSEILDISRNKASEIIKKSLVLVNDKVVTKNSFKVEDETISIKEHNIYVSRAAYKLLGFFEDVKLDVTSMKALDIGASTGGFTQILLEKGVSSVVSLDVGREQLDKSLRDNSKVEVVENQDIREYVTDKKFDIVVSDVSFISLEKILDFISPLCENHLVLLFKPQFEVGKNVKRDKNGVVLDKKAISKARESFELKCKSLGFFNEYNEESKLSGKEGNLEYIYYFTRD